MALRLIEEKRCGSRVVPIYYNTNTHRYTCPNGEASDLSWPVWDKDKLDDCKTWAQNEADGMHRRNSDSQWGELK